MIEFRNVSKKWENIEKNQLMMNERRDSVK